MTQQSNLWREKKLDTSILIVLCFLNIMSTFLQIVFNNPSSEDSLSPPEKQLKKEIWENRMKRLETGHESDCKIIVEDKTILTHKLVGTDYHISRKKIW